MTSIAWVVLVYMVLAVQGQADADYQIQHDHHRPDEPRPQLESAGGVQVVVGGDGGSGERASTAQDASSAESLLV